MKSKYHFGRQLTRAELKKILGGSAPPDGGGSCGLVCNNCVAFSIICSGDSFCEVSGQGLRCCHYDPPAGPYMTKYCGSVHPCPSGNYCG